MKIIKNLKLCQYYINNNSTLFEVGFQKCLNHNGKILLTVFEENTGTEWEYTPVGFLNYSSENNWEIKRIRRNKLDHYNDQDCYITEYNNKYYAVYF